MRVGGRRERAESQEGSDCSAGQGRALQSKVKVFVCVQLRKGTCWIFASVFFFFPMAQVFDFLVSLIYLIFSASVGPQVTLRGPTLSVEATISPSISALSQSINNGIVYLPISLLRKRDFEAQGDNSRIREFDSRIFSICPSLARIYGAASSAASYSQALLPGV